MLSVAVLAATFGPSIKVNKIRHLAVTDEDKIVGVLSIKDLVAYFAKDFRMQE